MPFAVQFTIMSSNFSKAAFFFVLVFVILLFLGTGVAAGADGPASVASDVAGTDSTVGSLLAVFFFLPRALPLPFALALEVPSPSTYNRKFQLQY